MSECCRVPGDHRGSEAQCPGCGRKGQRVKRRTLEHLLTGSALARLTDHPYFFCATPECPVVYFSNEAGSRFHKGDVRVRVGVKETEDPVPICYCFDIEATGRTAIPDYIKAQVKAGRCACETKNPSGRCCLGVVTTVVLRALRQREIQDAEPLQAPAQECCGRPTL
jgi:hypothetical protein